eukprot:3579451-Alexandrium_andersonii.AAC.1
MGGGDGFPGNGLEVAGHCSAKSALADEPSDQPFEYGTEGPREPPDGRASSEHSKAVGRGILGQPRRAPA